MCQLLPTGLLNKYSELEWAGETGEKARVRVAEGAIGQVYRAAHQGQDVAVKEFKELFSPQQEEDTEALKEFKAEVELLSSCRCPNIVLFVGYCFERADAERNAPYRLAIVTEFMARGSLWDNLHRRRIAPSACFPNARRLLQALVRIPLVQSPLGAALQPRLHTARHIHSMH